MKNIARELLAVVTALVAALLAFIALRFICAFLISGPFHAFGTLLFVLTCISVTLLTAYVIWRWMRRRLGVVGVLAARRAVVLAILVGYVVTWAFGVPAVHSALVKFEVAEYKRARAENNRVWDAHPRISFSFAIPVLPLVILSYHEYQLAGLYGWGGWDLHFWSGVRVTRIASLGTWVS